MKLLIGIILGIIFLSTTQILIGSFITERRSVELLDKLGFQNIRLADKSAFWVQFRGCSIGDVTRFTLKAENVRGKHVILETCEGLFKHATLRN